MCNRSPHPHDCTYVSISAPLLFGRICYQKYINCGGENKLEILHVFYVPEKVVKLTKNKITKIEENLKESEKHSLKCIDISYMACYWESQGVIDLGRKHDIRHRGVSAKQRYCYESLNIISSVPENIVRCREFSAMKDVRFKKVLLYLIYSTRKKQFET